MKFVKCFCNIVSSLAGMLLCRCALFFSLLCSLLYFSFYHSCRFYGVACWIESVLLVLDVNCSASACVVCIDAQLPAVKSTSKTGSDKSSRSSGTYYC